MTIDDITVRQIELMQHAIGFGENKVTGTKHRVMRAYRNYFCDHINNDWEELKAAGLADRIQKNSDGFVYYQLTEAGFQFLARLCGFEKIVEID